MPESNVQRVLNAVNEDGGVAALDLRRLTRFLIDSTDEKRMQRRMPKVQGQGQVAVIPVHGVLTHRGGWGVESTSRILRTIEAAMAHKSISGVVLDVDSPGGSSYGCEEVAERIYGLRGIKPLVAVANPLAASAAYWIATAATRVAVTPSGDVGSVGVYAAHIDYAKALEDSGIKVTFLHAGKFKIDGNSYEPLTESARESIQASVDDTYGKFVEAVAKHRGVSRAKVLSEYGEGRSLNAKAALDAGMVDRVATLDEVLAEMGAGNTSDGREVRATEFLCAVWDDKKLEVDQSGRSVEAMKRRRERRQRGGDVTPVVREQPTEEVVPEKRMVVIKRVERDANGLIVRVIETQGEED